jgi:hypothetical protein
MFAEEWTSGYRAEIRRRLAADFTGWERDNAKFEQQLEKVIGAFHVEENARERPKQTP